MRINEIKTVNVNGKEFSLISLGYLKNMLFFCDFTVLYIYIFLNNTSLKQLGYISYTINVPRIYLNKTLLART